MIFESVRFLNEKSNSTSTEGINIDIDPLKSVKILFGNKSQGIHISFNMNRDQIRNCINMDYRTFKKVRNSVPADDYYGLFHIYYDNEDNFEAIEFFEFDTATINHDTIKKDEHIERSDGYIDKEKSIGIGLRDNKVYSILAGVKDYYN